MKEGQEQINQTKIMTIRGEKVVLRPMTVEEIPIFYEWATDSDSTPFWYDDGVIPSYEQFTQDWGRHYFDGSDPHRGRCFTILIGNRAIGEINYNEINRNKDSVELDIIITNDTDKNKGYGTDALKALTKYLFQNMNIRLCWIEVVSSNIRATKAYEKAGFKPSFTFISQGKECKHMELSNL